jgi:hypothetical protein
MAKGNRGEGEFLLIAAVVILVLAIYGGWSIFQALASNADCQRWAERICYPSGAVQFRECVANTANRGNSVGAGWCREALRDLDK